MVVKKAKVKTRAVKPSRIRSNDKPPSYRDSIRLYLSAVAGVDAVYEWIDSRKIVHVVSVIKDFDPDIFDGLIPAENLVEKKNPEISFDFHVHARQKRTVGETVPEGAFLVFEK